MKTYRALALMLPSFALATDYIFLNEGAFVKPQHPWHVEGDFSKVGGASLTNAGMQGTKLHYSEGNAAVFFSHFINQENALSWQVGLHYIDVNWKQNPAFTENQYTYALASMNWISDSIQKWRWKIGAGISFDTKTCNVGQTGVYYGTLWGRYTHSDHLDLHLGFFGYYGAMNGFILPVLGFDWWMTPKWQLRAIFPQDAALRYHITNYFAAAILATSMGGPYRFPYRIQGGTTDQTSDGVFKIYSTALEGNLELSLENICTLGVGGGYDFGGWLLVMNDKSHHKRYYFFDGAPYVRFFASLTF